MTLDSGFAVLIVVPCFAGLLLFAWMLLSRILGAAWTALGDLFT
jgi:hypothetical protein